MLVLSRQKDESIIIGDDVEITIVDIRVDKVRLGISAPKNVTVHRKEVYEAIMREKGEQQEREKEKKYTTDGGSTGMPPLKVEDKNLNTEYESMKSLEKEVKETKRGVDSIFDKFFGKKK